MPKLLALDWNPRQLRVVLANRQGNALTIEDLRSVPFPAAPSTPDAETAEPTVGEVVSAQLRTILSDTRYRGAEALVTVRRSDAELRLLTLPPVPAEELPEIVRLQALREFSEISEDWPLDYLPLQGTADQMTVLAAVISPRRMQDYQRAMTQAELKARSLVLRPTATSLLVGHLADETRPSVELCVDDLDGEIEISVLREGTPILIRTVQAPRSADDDRVLFLRQEIRRTLLSAQNQLHDDPVTRIVMFGRSDSTTQTWARQLSAQLEMPVIVLDPFAQVVLSRSVDLAVLEKPGQFAAAIGLLVGESTGTRQFIDFLNPRKVEPPKSRRKLIAAVAAGVAVTLLATFGGFYWHLRHLDAEIRQMQSQQQDQRKLVEAAEKRIAEVASIDEWQQSNIDWLSQLREISVNIPDARRARFLRLQADVLSNGDGQIILEGIVDNQSTISEIEQALRSQERRVRGSGAEFDEGIEGYPWRFKETVTIETAPRPSPTAARPPRASRP